MSYDPKTITTYDAAFNIKDNRDFMNDYLVRRYKEVMARRGEIIEAFIAKYGCMPDEVVLVEGPGQFFVTRKKPHRLNRCHACGLLRVPADPANEEAIFKAAEKEISRF